MEKVKNVSLIDNLQEARKVPEKDIFNILKNPSIRGIVALHKKIKFGSENCTSLGAYPYIVEYCI